MKYKESTKQIYLEHNNKLYEIANYTYNSFVGILWLRILSYFINIAFVMPAEIEIKAFLMF